MQKLLKLLNKFCTSQSILFFNQDLLAIKSLHIDAGKCKFHRADAKVSLNVSIFWYSYSTSITSSLLNVTFSLLFEDEPTILVLLRESILVFLLIDELPLVS